MIGDQGFVFAKHETVLVDEDGELHLESPTPACDFCLDTRVEWEYPCARFVLEAIGFGSDDNWLACAQCSEHIESGAYAKLLLRGMKSWRLRAGKMGLKQIVSMQMIQQGFREHRNGNRFEYEKGS